jgi:hypothetical protein
MVTGSLCLYLNRKDPCFYVDPANCALFIVLSRSYKLKLDCLSRYLMFCLADSIHSMQMESQYGNSDILFGGLIICRRKVWKLYLLPSYGSGVESTPNRKEYQGYFLGVKAATVQG